MTGRAREQRSLRRYLLLPRPKDAVKWWILPLAFAVGVLAEGGVDSRDLIRALLVWAALELLIYQARYQWNDIRGFEADQRHPDAAGRGRLPGPPERGRAHIAASRTVAAARLAAAALLALALPSLDLASPLFILAAAVFGVAVLYELLRGVATGRSGAVPPRVTPAIAGVWIAVGGGYAARGVAGLALATDLWSPPALAVASVIALWSFGVAFVTARWALESLSFARMEAGRLEWRATADQAREHSLALARWLPAPGAARDAEQWRALASRTSFAAPWNLAALVAGAAAALTGALLVGQVEPAEGAVAAAAGAILSAIVLSAPRRRGAWCAAAAPALAATLALSGSPRPALAALPWLVVTGAHLFFAAQSLASLGHPLRALARSAQGRVRRPAPAPAGPAPRQPC